MDLRKSLPLSGIVFVVLLVLAVVVGGGDTPGSSASADKVASFYAGHNARQGISSFVLAATAPFLVLFALSMAGRSATAAGRERSIWEQLVVAGSVITSSAVVVAALIHFALVDGADQGVSPIALQALNVLDGNVWLPFNSGLGVMMLGAAGVLLGGAFLRRWLGWAALVFGIALFIPFADFFALILTLIWILAVSVMLYRAPQENRQPLVATA